ncbi:MAG TPA: hypothetical protein VGI39_39155 [Polyangiaceae bacterium]|jgi:hypothetical protein
MARRKPADREKARKALTLRAASTSLGAVAGSLGFKDEADVVRAIGDELAQNPLDREVDRRIELLKLDRYERKLDAILNPAKGDPKSSHIAIIDAVRVMTQIGARRAKLQRLDHADVDAEDGPSDVRPAFFGPGILPRG